MMHYTKQYRDLYTESEWFSTVHDYFEKFTSANTEIYKEKILSKLQKHFGDTFYRKPFFVLDIGGGNGKRSRYILDPILKQHNKIALDYNDVSTYQLRKYQSVHSEWLSGIFVGDFDEVLFHKKYDCILSIHSLYGASNWNSNNHEENTLVKIRDLLKPGGLACIIIRDKNNISYFLHNSFKDYIGIHDPTICAEEIVFFLQKFHIQYDIDEAHTITPPKDLFKNNSLSDLSINFIVYYMHKKFNDIKPEYIKIITEEIKKRTDNFEIDSSRIIWIYT